MRKTFEFANGVVGMTGAFLILGGSIGAIPASLGFAVEKVVTDGNRITAPAVGTSGIAFISGWTIAIPSLFLGVCVEHYFPKEEKNE